MSDAHEIDIVNLILFMLLFFVPVIILLQRNIPYAKDLLVSVVRMVVQLVFMGLYLQVLFEKNSLLLTSAWLFMMVIVANITILQRAGLKRRFLFVSTGVGLLVSTFIVTLGLLFTVGATPWYDARYLIPMVGMVLGNSLQGNVIALERFYSSLQNERDIYEMSLFNGASRFKALAPFINQALSSAISPSIGGMMTMGLVSLPGMMTGQILGGTMPIEAIKYQLVIMAAIFLTLFLSVLFNLLVTPLVTLTPFGMLRREVFRKQ